MLQFSAVVSFCYWTRGGKRMGILSCQNNTFCLRAKIQRFNSNEAYPLILCCMEYTVWRICCLPLGLWTNYFSYFLTVLLILCWDTHTFVCLVGLGRKNRWHLSSTDSSLKMKGFGRKSDGFSGCSCSRGIVTICPCYPLAPTGKRYLKALPQENWSNRSNGTS